MTEQEMLELLRRVEDHLRYDCGHCSGEQAVVQITQEVGAAIAKLTCHMTPDVLQKIEAIQNAAFTTMAASLAND